MRFKILPSFKASRTDGFATFSSRGKQVLLELPSDWKSEANGNGVMFYPKNRPGGTLRLDVLSLRKGDGPTLADYSWIEQKAKEHDALVEILPDGGRLIEYLHEYVEEGEEMHHTHWHLQYFVNDLVVIPIASWSVEQSLLLGPDGGPPFGWVLATGLPALGGSTL